MVKAIEKAFFYENRESKTLEFKSKLPQFHLLIKTCIAFANGVGGKIIIGVDDKSKKIIGITDHDRDRLYDEFPNSLYDSVRPTLFIQIWEKRYNDASVLVIDVPISPKKPYYFKSEGIPKGVYIRVGSSSRRANQDYTEELIREGKHLTFDEETIPEPKEILSKELLTQFYSSRITEKRLFADKVIHPSPTKPSHYSPTVTGILFFTEEPHQYLPETTILCTRFKGNQGREIIQTQELYGPIDLLADQAFQLISSWLTQNYHMKSLKLVGKLPIPPEALREAIINSLIHRKYSIPGAIKIAIYDHHIEIFNPGCFPGVVDLKSLGDGTTYLRNPNIAKIARKMGLVEKLGSGIRMIFDSCKKAGLKKPEYMEGGDFVKVIFSLDPAKDNSKSDEDSIMSLFSKRKELSVTEVMNYLGVSRNTATRKLNSLIKKGKVIRTGKGPSVRYYLR